MFVCFQCEEVFNTKNEMIGPKNSKPDDNELCKAYIAMKCPRNINALWGSHDLMDGYENKNNSNNIQGFWKVINNHSPPEIVGNKQTVMLNLMKMMEQNMKTVLGQSMNIKKNIMG